MADDLRRNIKNALAALAGGAPLRKGTRNLLNALGYSSNRTVDAGSVPEFLERFRGAENPLTDRQRGLFESWSAVEIVFQFTKDEIGGEPSLFDGPEFDRGRIESFLFLAVDMKADVYTRTRLAEMTRFVNRFFHMPVIILFRYGSALTLAAVHRRANKRDNDRDVLEKVTFVKDIRLENPHRAHIETLAELAFHDMLQTGVRSFDDLHVKWEQVLDIEELNKRFYHELFVWFNVAVSECRFPNDGAGENSDQRHVTRMITRLLFIWFLKEKGLVPEDLFEERFAREQLKNYEPESTDYYRAVLQNLFFATLNTEIDKRAFSTQTGVSHRDFSKYRYRGLLEDPDGFVEKLRQVPFVNGGLFDCLDDFAAAGAGGQRIDAFTDNIRNQGRDLHVPARLLLDEEDGLFALFRRYKFTVEESTPLDIEVALDPELLGRAFENLLAAYNPETRKTARQATGSYYTPRQVVDYMVQESLTEVLASKSEPADGDTGFWRDRLQYLLDHSAAMDDAADLFEEEKDRRAVVAAISGIRTLDLAVGSGAFPMGILQTLTMALRRLDPDNMFWEKFQKERAATRAGQAFDTEDRQQRDDELAEISTTFEKYRESDFGRKLYLIQNSIYGVDIQPIACQIAKLRFFISLVIEQNPDPNLENFGIKPLPNLETRLVAADSLIGIKPEATDLLHEDAVASKRREVDEVRERYFLADSRQQKLKYIEKEKRLRCELYDVLETGHRCWVTDQEKTIESKVARFPRADAREAFRKNELCKLALRQRKYDETLKAAKRIAEWDPYNQNAHADWFDAEHMFGVSDGFDVVIGNPPYIQLQKNGGEARKRYRGEGYETFSAKGDIYQLFYERGCLLLKPPYGVLAYITSNSWLKAEYGKPLRRWFAEHHMPLKLIEMGKDVFENAIVDTAVLVVRNGSASPVTCSAVDIEQASEDRFPPPKADWGTLRPKGDRPWMALSSVERAVMEKMESVGTPLREWDISIYYGIKTGYNDAFIVDTAMRDRLVAEDPASEEILKPILRGRDIARYRANWTGLWLISTFPSLGIDIEAYPAIKRHLLSFGKERLAQEGRRLPGGGQSRSKTPYAWHELQSTCAYHAQFSDEKLFWMDLTTEGRFSYAPADKEIFCINTVYFMHGPMMKRLAAFLNSSLITWYVNKSTVTSGMGTARWFAVTVEAIPIPKIIKGSDRVDTLVDDLLCAVDESTAQRVDDLESAIEELVYQSYGITECEQETIRRARIG